MRSRPTPTRRCCATLAQLGAGMDVVSEGELRRALAAGVPADKIIFAGVGKTREEMAYALEQGILGFNVESEPELRALSEVATGLGHDGARRAARQSRRRRQDARQDLDRQGGEQVRHSLRPGAPALCRGRQAARHRRRRHPHAHRQPDHRSGAVPQRLPADARAGRGADRRRPQARSISTSAAASACRTCRTARWRRRRRRTPQIVKEQLGDLGLKIVLEPGRVIVGNAGVLVTRVIYGKEGVDKTFTVVDAAMNDLIRPTLYEAQHEVWPVAGSQGGDAPDRAGHRRPGVRDRRLSGARPQAAAARRPAI